MEEGKAEKIVEQRPSQEEESSNNNNSNTFKSSSAAVAEAAADNDDHDHHLCDHDDDGVTELTVDEVIEGHVGSFGLSQILHVLLVSIAWIFDSQHTLVTIFSDAQPSAWKCKSTINSSSSSCNSTLFNVNDVSVVCGLKEGTWEWIGGHKSSIIAEWNLICHRKFLAALPASLFFLGSLLGSAFFGRLSDKYLGRKKSVFISCISTSATAFLTSLSPNIWIYSLLRFTNGFSRSGIGICCIVLATEVVGHKWRGQVGQYGFFLFTAGFLSLPFIAYPTRHHWRNLYRVLSLFPLAYAVILLPFASESPRWLHVRGRTKEALDVLKKFAKRNGKKLPINLTLSSPTDVKSEGEPSTERKESLWTTKWAAKRLILTMAAGFGVGFVYYGIQLNVENLNFNLYFSVAINALMEIPAVLIGSLLLSLTNRRRLFSSSAILAGVCCFLCIIFSHGSRVKAKNINSKPVSGSWPQLAIEAIGFMAASIAFDVLYIYCVELFPTNVRNIALSFSRQALMLGASVAPLLVAVGRLSPWLSFIIFGSLSVFSGVLTFWLPETKNAPLYETLKQQGEEENLKRLSKARADSSSALELGVNGNQ